MESRDPAAFVRETQAGPPEDRLAAYRSLSTFEGQRIASWALAELGIAITGADSLNDVTGYEEDGLSAEVLLFLACLVPDSLSGIQHALAVRHVLGHPIIYRGADTATRDYLIAAHQRETSPLTRRRIVEALAWIGDAVVVIYFRQCGLASKQLVAGWELDGETPHWLWLEWCCRLEHVAPNVSTSDEDPVNVGIQQEDACGWCGLPLTTLFDLRLSGVRPAFPAMTGDRLRIAMCDQCTFFLTTFTEVDFYGRSTWSTHNSQQKSPPPTNAYDWPRRQVRLGRWKRSPIESYETVSEWDNVSQLGGCPTWLPYPEYPDCPSCGHSMLFIGQLAFDLLDNYGPEGIIHAYLCQTCNIAATNYQQT
jgi:hypothetical protein